MDYVTYQDGSLEESASTSIENLNDDCLIHLFSLLPVAERIRAERVCKKWQEVSKKSWNNSQVLNLDPSCLGLKPKIKIYKYPGEKIDKRYEYPRITEYIAEEILKRYGKRLKKICLKKVSYYYKLDLGCLVAKYCSNIHSISCFRLKDYIICLTIVQISTICLLNFVMEMN